MHSGAMSPPTSSNQNPVLGPIIADDAPKVMQIISKLRIDIQDVVFCRLFLEQGNDPKVIEALNTSGSGKKTILLIRGAIVQRLVMALMRMHDRKSGDRDCLAQVFHLLSDTDERARMTRHGGDGQIDEAHRIWKSLDESSLQSFRRSRDFEIAHSIMVKLGPDKPRWGDLLKLCKETENIIECLSDGVGACTVPLKHHADFSIKDINQYWRYFDIEL